MGLLTRKLLLLAHKHSLLIRLRALKRLRKKKTLKSWWELYKMKWLAVEDAGILTVTPSCNKENAC